MSLYAIIALLLFLLVPAFSGGGSKQSSKAPPKSSPSPTENPSLNLPPVPDPPKGDTGGNPATPVPTPALLPGLIGLGVQVARKRKSEANEEVTDSK